MKGTDISGVKHIILTEGKTHVLEQTSFVWFSVVAATSGDIPRYTIIDGVTLSSDYENSNASIFAKGTEFECPTMSGMASPKMYLTIYPLTKSGGVRISSYHIVSLKRKSKKENLCH